MPTEYDALGISANAGVGIMDSHMLLCTDLNSVSTREEYKPMLQQSVDQYQQPCEPFGQQLFGMNQGSVIFSDGINPSTSVIFDAGQIIGVQQSETIDMAPTLISDSTSAAIELEQNVSSGEHLTGVQLDSGKPGYSMAPDSNNIAPTPELYVETVGFNSVTSFVSSVDAALHGQRNSSVSSVIADQHVHFAPAQSMGSISEQHSGVCDIRGNYIADYQGLQNTGEGNNAGDGALSTDLSHTSNENGLLNGPSQGATFTVSFENTEASLGPSESDRNGGQSDLPDCGFSTTVGHDSVSRAGVAAVAIGTSSANDVRTVRTPSPNTSRKAPSGNTQNNQSLSSNKNGRISLVASGPLSNGKTGQSHSQSQLIVGASAGNKRKVSGNIAHSSIASGRSPETMHKHNAKEVEPGIKIWKRLCLQSTLTASVVPPQAQNQNQQTTKSKQDDKGKKNNNCGSASSGIIAAPSFDEAVSILGLAPVGGVSGSTSKQINDTPQEMKKIMQMMLCEIAASKRAALKAQKDFELERERELTVSNAAAQDASSLRELKGKGRNGQRVGVSAPNAVASEKEKEKEKEDQHPDEWVLCDQCSKWRRLPARTDPNFPNDLPEKWVCSMNTWDVKTSTCSAPQQEDTFREPPVGALKIKVWCRRLRSGDRFEQRHSRRPGGLSGNHLAPSSASGSLLSATYENNRDFGEVDWIRCCSPSCGKWRACLRSMDARVLRDMYPIWHCWMNTWDDARASCNAPQEGTVVRSLAPRGKQSTRVVKATDSSSMAVEVGTGDGDSIDGEIVEDNDDEVTEQLVPNAPSARRERSGSMDGTKSNANDGFPALTSKGVSSKGRIVRSRWANTRQVVK